MVALFIFSLPARERDAEAEGADKNRNKIGNKVILSKGRARRDHRAAKSELGSKIL